MLGMTLAHELDAMGHLLDALPDGVVITSGRIWLRSREGMGTTFTFKLPRWVEPA